MPTPTVVFISYAQEDDDLRRELESHLALLKRARVIEGWHRGRVGPGSVREEAVAARINQARVILLLVSTEFLASEGCYERELTRALARHEQGRACVIPVLARACDLTGAPFAALSAVPEENGAPLPVTSWPKRDDAWTRVTEAVREAVVRLSLPAQAEASAP